MVIVDHYLVLQISRTASARDVKTAYKKYALLYHPDKNSLPGAQDKFLAIQTAYEILSDPVQKKLYDEGRLTEGLQTQFRNFYENPQQTRDQEEYLQRRRDLTKEYDLKVQQHNERRAQSNLVGTSAHFKGEKEFCQLEIEFLENEKKHFEREIVYTHLGRLHGRAFDGMPVEYYQKKIERLETKIKKFHNQAKNYEEQQKEMEDREKEGDVDPTKTQFGQSGQKWKRAVAAIFERHLP